MAAAIIERVLAGNASATFTLAGIAYLKESDIPAGDSIVNATVTGSPTAVRIRCRTLQDVSQTTPVTDTGGQSIDGGTYLTASVSPAESTTGYCMAAGVFSVPTATASWSGSAVETLDQSDPSSNFRETYAEWTPSGTPSNFDLTASATCNASYVGIGFGKNTTAVATVGAASDIDNGGTYTAGSGTNRIVVFFVLAEGPNALDLTALDFSLAGPSPATRIPFLGSFGRPRTRYAV